MVETVINTITINIMVDMVIIIVIIMVVMVIRTDRTTRTHGTNKTDRITRTRIRQDRQVRDERKDKHGRLVNVLEWSKRDQNSCPRPFLPFGTLLGLSGPF